MEIRILTTARTNEITITNKKLAAKTKQLVNAFDRAKKSFVDVGRILTEIKNEALYKDDFIDKHGRSDFGAYTSAVLGISKSQAYKIMNATNRLLLPETDDKSVPIFFSNFSDAALAELGAHKELEDYSFALQFCDEYGINEQTPVRTIADCARDFAEKIAKENGTVKTKKTKSKSKPETSEEVETTGEEVETTGEEVENTDGVKEIEQELVRLVINLLEKTFSTFSQNGKNYNGGEWLLKKIGNTEHGKEIIQALVEISMLTGFANRENDFLETGDF